MIPTAKTKSSVIKINGEEFEEVPRVSLAASKILADVWQGLGKPTSPLTDSGQKLMKIIISVWEDLYPKDSKEWYEMRTEYKNSELTIREQVHKHTGRSLASYPVPIYLLMKKLFPTFKLSERKNNIKLVSVFPMFQMCQKV